MRRLGKGEVIHIVTTATQSIDCAGALVGGVLPESSEHSALALLLRARALAHAGLGDIDAAIKKIRERAE